MEGSLWKSFGESRAVDIKVKVNVKVKVEERFFLSQLEGLHWNRQ